MLCFPDSKFSKKGVFILVLLFSKEENLALSLVMRLCVNLDFKPTVLTTSPSLAEMPLLEDSPDVAAAG